MTATNVTIKNSRISDVGFFGVDIEGGSVTLQNVEIDCGGTGTKGILNGNFTAIRVNIHNCEDGVFADRDFTIRDSYIHDLATSPTAHNDGIQSIDAINVTIEHNRIYASRYIGDMAQQQQRRSARAECAGQRQSARWRRLDTVLSSRRIYQRPNSE